MIHPSGDRHWTRRTPERVRRGADSHAAKLSEHDIDAICTTYAALRPSKTWLARKYGVSRITIWRHLKDRGLV